MAVGPRLFKLGLVFSLVLASLPGLFMVFAAMLKILGHS
jgi:hypothetical protein